MPPDKAPDSTNQPHIVLFNEADDDVTGQYFISIEQTLMMESLNVIFNLVFHYVFNLAYHPKAKDMLTFIQERMLGISSDTKVEKKSINPISSSHVSGIIRVKTELDSIDCVPYLAVSSFCYYEHQLYYGQKHASNH